MSFYNVIEGARKMREMRREEEKKKPEILDKWASTVPTAVNIGVSAGTGSHNAGRVAGAAASVAIESNPKLKRKAGEVARDIAYDLTTEPRALFELASLFFRKRK